MKVNLTNVDIVNTTFKQFKIILRMIKLLCSAVGLLVKTEKTNFFFK